MLQIAVYEYILLVDLFIIKILPEVYAKAAEWIRSLMSNREILKVFFDCHKDSEALHKGLSSCVENVLDVQAMHMLLKQWKTEIKEGNTVSTPGLNKSLGEYKASHGINEYKEEMKRIFNEEYGSYGKRPLSLMYIRYAAKDVEDLIEVKDKMLAELSSIFKDNIGIKLAQVLSTEYVKQGCVAALKKKNE
jgi:hypothetical protein